MEKSSILRQVAGAAVIALPVIFSANAHAGGLKGGECYSAEFARSVLAQEGQRPVLITDRDTFIRENQNANFFFVNDQGYGYNIEGNHSYGGGVENGGKPQSKMCVRASFKDAHLNDPNNPVMPSWGKFIKPSGTFDPEKSYRNGGRFVFAARTYDVQPNGQEKLGAYIAVLFGTKDEKYGQLLEVSAVNPDGTSAPSFDGMRSIVTQHLYAYLENLPASMRPTPSASVSGAQVLAVSR